MIILRHDPPDHRRIWARDIIRILKHECYSIAPEHEKEKNQAIEIGEAIIDGNNPATVKRNDVSAQDFESLLLLLKGDYKAAILNVRHPNTVLAYLAEFLFFDKIMFRCKND